MGSARSFFPLNGASTATGNKLEESFLLNDGLSATVGRKRYNLLPDTPYNKSEFANRIMFSNVNVTDSFTGTKANPCSITTNKLVPQEINFVIAPYCLS